MEYYSKLRNLQIFTHVVSFIGILWVIQTGGWNWLWFALASYYILNLIGNSIGYHRYVCHHSFETYKPIEYFMLFIGMTMSIGSPMLWAAAHRAHHVYADTDKDPHSHHTLGYKKALLGLWNYDNVRLNKLSPDLLKNPTMRWTHRHYFKVVYGYAAILLIIDPKLFAFGWALPAVITLWHIRFTLVWSHEWGSRHFNTPDASINHPILALISGGDGWHNNHHKYPDRWSTQVKWYEIDPPAYVIWLIKKNRFEPMDRPGDFITPEVPNDHIRLDILSKSNR